MKAFALKLGLIAANENKLMQVTNSTDQGLESKKSEKWSIKLLH